MRAPALSLAALVIGSTACFAQSKPVLIRDARVTVKPGVVLEATSILIENGLISKIGGDISAPDGAQVIEARGLNVYPGLIHGYLRATTTEPRDPNAPEQPARQLSSDEQAAERMRSRDKDLFFLDNNLQSHKLMSFISG